MAENKDIRDIRGDSSYSADDFQHGNSFRDAIVETQAQIEQIRLGEEGSGAAADAQVIKLIQGLEITNLNTALEIARSVDGLEIPEENITAMEARLAEIESDPNVLVISPEDLAKFEADLEKIVHGDDADIQVGSVYVENPPESDGNQLDLNQLTPIDGTDDGVLSAVKAAENGDEQPTVTNEEPAPDTTVAPIQP